MTAQHPAAEYVLVNARTGAALAYRLGVARSSWRRALSLLGRRWLDRGEGVRFLPGCAQPQQRLPVDVLFLDRDGLVLHAVHSLSPFEVGAGEGVHSVVELPAGTLARLDTRAGDVVEMFRTLSAPEEGPRDRAGG